MKPVVYIESSVVSYLVARTSRDVVVAGRQALTQDWWENERTRFDLRVSALVEDEVSRGDPSAAERRLAIVEEIPILAAASIIVPATRAGFAQRTLRRAQYP